LFVFLNEKPYKERDDAAKSQQLVFPRLPHGCLYSLHGTTGWAADTIALVTKSSASTSSSQYMGFQLCAGLYLLPNIQKSGDREPIRF
jgi:hypothetical protein